jgi:lipopolysaccharide transport system ATP-binding protein
MYVRLAFAVAAHLEPEILIVDEVLAVGDAAFQKKCLGKMEEVGREGRTVLFVSHNLVAVEGLCTRALVLESGAKKFDGNVREGLSVYNTSLGSLISEDLSLRNDRSGNGLLRFSGYSLFNEDGHPVDCAISGKCLIVKIRYETAEELSNVNVAFNLYEKENDILLNFYTLDVGREIPKIENKGEFICKIPYFPLREGLYYGNLYCTVNGVLADWLRPGVKIKVIDSDAHGTGRLVAQGKFVTTYDWGIGGVKNNLNELLCIN